MTLISLRRPGLLRSKSIRGRLPGRLARGAGAGFGGLSWSKDPGEDQAALEEDDKRHHLDQHRDRVRARKKRRDDGDYDDRVAPVSRQLLGGDDSEPGQPDDPD